MPAEHLRNLRRTMWAWRVAYHALYVLAVAFFVSMVLGLATYATGSTWWLTSEQYMDNAMFLSFAVTGIALWCVHALGGKAALRRLFEKQ